MNRVTTILRSTFVPLLALRLTAMGLLGCTNIAAADDIEPPQTDVTPALR